MFTVILAEFYVFLTIFFKQLIISAMREQSIPVISPLKLIFHITKSTKRKKEKNDEK